MGKDNIFVTHILKKYLEVYYITFSQHLSTPTAGEGDFLKISGFLKTVTLVLLTKKLRERGEIFCLLTQISMSEFSKTRCILKLYRGLKLNVAHQLLAYADDVNILAGSINTLKENAKL